MSDKQLKQLIKDWNHSLITNDMQSAAALLADSVSVFLWDGSHYNTTRDSILLVLKDYVDKYSDVNVAHVAGLSVRNKDTGEYWGLSWTTETYNRDDGTTADLMLQESFLIQDGKIHSIRQYMQKYTENPNAIYQPEENPDYTYSGSFEMEDDELKEIVIGWSNALATPADYDAAVTFLADTVNIFSVDGDYVRSDRDSALSFIKSKLIQYNSMDIEFVADISVKSTDQRQTWVLLWTEVTFTDHDGEKKHVHIHEDYMIEDNKISTIRRYSMNSPIN